MTDTTETLFHSIANPRRTTLVTVSAAEAAAPGAPAHPAAPAFTMVGDAGAGTCVDGVCALPE